MGWLDWVRATSWRGEKFSLFWLLSGAPDGEPCFRSDVAGNEASMRSLRGIARQLNKYRRLNYQQGVVAGLGSPYAQVFLMADTMPMCGWREAGEIA